MAAAEKGGYDYEFVPELPEDYNCVICQCALRLPKQIEPCGHRFCDSCYKDLKDWNRSSDDVQCPYDRQVFKAHQVFSDKATERLILNWKVKCPNNKTGCSWIGELNAAKEHEINCNSNITNSGSKSLEERVIKLEKELFIKSSEINKCRNELVACRDELKLVKNENLAEVNQCKDELQVCKTEINNLKDEVKKLSGKIKSQKTMQHQCENKIIGEAAQGSSSGSVTSSPVNHQFDMRFPISYSDTETYTRRFYYNDYYAFQLGFNFDDYDDLYVTLYRCRGDCDDEYEYIRNEFPNDFKLKLILQTKEGSNTTVLFTKNIWTIGGDYDRSLGEEYCVGDFNNFDINGFYVFRCESDGLIHL